MDLTVWVDVALGITIVYLGTSLFVTIINEYIAQFFNLRGRNLFHALGQLIQDQKLRADLQNIPALKPYFEGLNSRFKRLRGPSISYIDTQVLAQMLLELIAPQSTKTIPAEQQTSLQPSPPPQPSPPAMPDPGKSTSTGTSFQPREKAEVLQDLAQASIDVNLKRQLMAVVQSASDSMESVTQAVSNWADRSLTMLGEHYKRNMQILSFIVSLFVAGILNIDTLALVEHLYKDKELRTATAEFAIRIQKELQPGAIESCTKLSIDEQRKKDECKSIPDLVDAIRLGNQSLGKLPIGWPTTVTDYTPKPLQMVGWFLTALAASLGAPFWFDLLTKLVNVRHGMRRPEVVAKEEKK